MRALPLLLLWPVSAGAETMADTHFARNFCWERSYSTAHLAEHPEQTVTSFRIGRAPLGHPRAPGKLAMELTLTFRGANGGRGGEEIPWAAECRPNEDALRCFLEGDAGEFRIEAAGQDILVTVGEEGLSFEGRELHLLQADEGDDRAFLLRRCG